MGRLPNLKSLNVTGNKLLKAQELITLAVNCRNLQDLRILDTGARGENQSLLKDEDLIFMTTHLSKNLTTLKIDMRQLGNVSYQVNNKLF